MDLYDINRNIVNFLSPNNPERIRVFGSFAIMEVAINSDVEILVKFRSTFSLPNNPKITKGARPPA
jgi:predicted nucleotidyltransferase